MCVQELPSQAQQASLTTSTPLPAAGSDGTLDVFACIVWFGTSLPGLLGGSDERILCQYFTLDKP